MTNATLLSDSDLVAAFEDATVSLAYRYNAETVGRFRETRRELLRRYAELRAVRLVA